MLEGLLVSLLGMIFLFAHRPCETLFSDDGIMNLHDFTLDKSTICDSFYFILLYLFRPCSLMSFGIKLCSILSAFWYQIQCFMLIDFYMISRMVFLLIFEPKMKLTGSISVKPRLPFSFRFRSLFDKYYIPQT